MKYLKNFNENNIEDMSKPELKRSFRQNFVATTANIEKLVDDTKDYTEDEMISIANSLGVTACALYVLKMKEKYNKRVSI